MVVRNILSVAPDARIFDLPLIPEAILDVGQFLCEAQAALEQVLADIEHLRKDRRWGGPWILVNAWAIFHLRRDDPFEDYHDNPDHPFNRLIRRALDKGIDVVFAAGNCGTFCPDMRCGALNRAPGESIFGAHALPGVITAGAVRADGIWLGYSSQGPGPARLAAEKPDFCAPASSARPTTTTRATPAPRPPAAWPPASSPRYVRAGAICRRAKRMPCCAGRRGRPRRPRGTAVRAWHSRCQGRVRARRLSLSLTPAG